MHLFGVWGYRQEGEVTLRGCDLKKNTPKESIDLGMVLASEDRRRYGLLLEQGIGFNLSLSSLKTLCSFGFVCKRDEAKRNQGIFDDLRIKATGLDTIAGRLSGGNQQKIVLGKALLAQPSVILLDEPTRGIDVGAKLEIYEIINQLTAAGKAVLLVSSELQELIGMSDRILMLREGKIGGEFNRVEVSQEKLLQAAVS
jgi:D-xylose transport system ATP-binding protein